MGGDQPYVGMLLLVPYNFAPTGWHLCDGSLLPISDYQALFTLIGTTYGGDGVSTFAVPDLRGRVSMGQGRGHVLGEQAGVESVTLIPSEYPSHSHTLMATTQPQTSNSAQGNFLASVNAYAASSSDAVMAPAEISTTPGSFQPHENRQPFQVLTWVISLFGVFPSQG